MLFVALASVSILAIPVIAQFTGTFPNRRGHFWANAYDIGIAVPEAYIYSNLYGFGHMTTPAQGSIVPVDWAVSDVDYFGNEKKFYGTFTIGVPAGPNYIEGGEIYVSFIAHLERIPLITEPQEGNAHIHFWGRFIITGGTGQYASLKGRGDISGTIHLHEILTAPESPYYDLVLIGMWST